MWLYRHKKNANGDFERHKARLIINGRNQQVGVDCDETFSPQFRSLTFHLLPRQGNCLHIALGRRYHSHLLLQISSAIYHDTSCLHGLIFHTSCNKYACLCTTPVKNICKLYGVSFATFKALLSLVYTFILLPFRHSSPTQTRTGVAAQTRAATSGYCVFLGDNLISWSAKWQPTLLRSSAEAEYRGMANVVAESCWLRNLLLELRRPIHKATVVYCDNVSAVYLSGNPVQHQQTKHIEMDIHFVREKVSKGQVRVLHVPSGYQIADIFTKGLPQILFEDFRSSLSVRLPPARTEAVY
ncbi:uncharacterized protein LOC110735520 [Chenopodium quinoa]|uniref:uncharacterized protein LOC110735520 n=1 Tax=Chenopodium quinoa TaxID=63459 RepID=UPI000B788116|nr:uncharacterized protein LOC110735520 [Chenopodium quinoa]